ncbi:MAG: hypothetical protein WKF78_05430 [Candidatus Limnocylindrales bacterium]
MDDRQPLVGSAAVSWGADRIDLFTVDDAGGLVHRVFLSGTWSAPGSLGGTLASSPAATAWGVDQLQVFAIFEDGALWNRYWDGTSWHPWESLGGELTGTPAASSWGADRIDVFAPGRDGRSLASLVGRRPLGGLGPTLGAPPGWWPDGVQHVRGWTPSGAPSSTATSRARPSPSRGCAATFTHSAGVGIFAGLCQ